MKKLLLALALLSSNTMAVDLSGVWAAPTKREDGSTLNASDISEYRMYVKNTDATYTLLNKYPARATSAKLVPFTGTKTLVIRAVDDLGQESGDSNEVKVTFSSPKAPPLKITVTAP